MISVEKISALRAWLIARGEDDKIDILSKEREDIRLLTKLPEALALHAKGEDTAAWKPAFEAISLTANEAKLTKSEQSQLIQQLIVPAISGTWNRTPDFAQTNICPRVLELMLKVSPPGKTVVDFEIGTGELLVQAIEAGQGKVVKVKGFSEPIYRQIKLQPADEDRAKELAKLAQERSALLLESSAIEIYEKPAKAYHYQDFGFNNTSKDIGPISAYFIPWQALDGDKARMNDCMFEAQRITFPLNSVESNTLAVLVPYSLMYARDFNQSKLGEFCRRRGLSTVIQLPAGSRGDLKDQPFLLIHRSVPLGHDSLPVLFIDATRAPRASEHGRALSAEGLNMIIKAFQHRESFGQVYTSIHKVDANFFNQGFPPMGKLVEPPVEAEPTLQSMREESDRLTEEIGKLRNELKDLFDR